jgi:hypothetical protein
MTELELKEEIEKTRNVFKYGSKREMGLRKGFGYQQKSGLPDRKVYGNTQSENGCGTVKKT